MTNIYNYTENCNNITANCYQNIYWPKVNVQYNFFNTVPTQTQFINQFFTGYNNTVNNTINIVYKLISDSIDTYINVYKLSPEQLREFEETRKQEEAARLKAVALLKELLPPEIHAALHSPAGFRYSSKLIPGRDYVIFDMEPRISVYEKRRYVGGLCIHSKEGLPPEDEIALKLALLINDEKKVLDTANFHRGTSPPRGSTELEELPQMPELAVA
jgi:hypothetical protein